jgi:hypothetical protein
MGSVAKDHGSTPLLWVALPTASRVHAVVRSLGAPERAPQDDNDGERGKRSQEHAAALGGLADCVEGHAVVGSLGARSALLRMTRTGVKRSPEHATALGGPCRLHRGCIRS